MRPLAALWIVPALLLAGCGEPGGGSDGYVLTPVVEGLTAPVGWFPVPGSTAALIPQQDGLVRVWDSGRGGLRDASMLDLRDRVRHNGEQGLLGLALGPDFAATGAVYVHHSDREGTSVLARYIVDPTTLSGADDGTTLLRVHQPYPNHNGGAIVFGPDKLLYMGLGDGGLADDPEDNGQDPDTLLGSILRLQVGAVRGGFTSGYRIPADNPFVGGGGEPEVWVYGLRNPWRFSFDDATGDLWIADVGQNAWEEINRLSPADQSGANLGWAAYEGTHPFKDIEPTGPVVAPVAQYAHIDGRCSVTGGHVYRGDTLPLDGQFVFGDYCTGEVWALEPTRGRWNMVRLLDSDLRISAFGLDADGEIMVVDHQGSVWRLGMG